MIKQLLLTLIGRKWLVVGALLAIAACAAGVSVYGAVKYHRGKTEGIAQDRKRSDAIIAQMLAEASTALAAANAREAALNAHWQAQLKEAQDAATQQLQLNARRLAAERAASGELRQQLAAYAAGGATESGDSIAACRERAAALGVVVAATLLPALAECAATAEDHAAGVRALLAAWPVEAP